MVSSSRIARSFTRYTSALQRHTIVTKIKQKFPCPRSRTQGQSRRSETHTISRRRSCRAIARSNLGRVSSVTLPWFSCPSPAVVALAKKPFRTARSSCPRSRKSSGCRKSLLSWTAHHLLDEFPKRRIWVFLSFRIGGSLHRRHAMEKNICSTRARIRLISAISLLSKPIVEIVVGYPQSEDRRL
uniref:ORF184 protein n=1 Tax=Turritis glabra TaxID=63678 RepID=A0A5H2UXV5_TURGL|nr:ORF184 protein [Turritis glabra]